MIYKVDEQGKVVIYYKTIYATYSITISNVDEKLRGKDATLESLEKLLGQVRMKFLKGKLRKQ